LRHWHAVHWLKAGRSIWWLSKPPPSATRPPLGARRQGFLGGLVRLRREGGQASKWVSTAPRGVKDRDCRDGPRAAESERPHWHARAASLLQPSPPSRTQLYALSALAD
jgi:hypothetical protein